MNALGALRSPEQREFASRRAWLTWARPTARSLFEEACAFVRSSRKHTRLECPIDLDRGLVVARRIVESLDLNQELLRIATERSQGSSPGLHSASIAVIACGISQALGVGEAGKRHVVLAGLLHGINRLVAPSDPALCEAGLSRQDWEIVVRLPLISAQLPSAIPEAGVPARQVLSISDWLNERRIPLNGKEIQDAAYSLTVATRFESGIHGRSDQRAVTGYDAMQRIVSATPRLPARIVKAALRTLSAYPLNEMVVLNNGEIGQVIQAHPDSPLRPILKLLYSASREPFNPPKFLDLAFEPSLFISGSVVDRSERTPADRTHRRAKRLHRRKRRRAILQWSALVLILCATSLLLAQLSRPEPTSNSAYRLERLMDEAEKFLAKKNQETP